MQEDLFELDFADRDRLIMVLPALTILLGELIEAAGDKLIFGPFGLSVPKYSLLAALNGPHNRISMTSLKDTILLLRSASNLTQLVDSLEERGLVRRIPSPEDRRVALVEITEAGRELVREVDAHYLNVMKDYARELDLPALQTHVRWLIEQIQSAAEVLGLERLKGKGDHPPRTGP